ncbi:hypothetical protein JKP75_02565 [Blastococcus sp. TML/M2B]|uniref:hypothetical protein n=1 Tax=Blastococcus sp. TML/M2B TaxID=2798727 RepID=UPI00190AA396|nr:hypothetical protein [Blastococcus sp. TML/M2B]MBN1091556.1 hypothetical protein [Blastococcus sp. TML/M2B]
MQALPPGDVGAWADAVERVVADRAGYARAALADADEARRRHAPERYRDELVGELRALVGDDRAVVAAP